MADLVAIAGRCVPRVVGAAAGVGSAGGAGRSCGGRDRGGPDLDRHGRRSDSSTLPERLVEGLPRGPRGHARRATSTGPRPSVLADGVAGLDPRGWPAPSSPGVLPGAARTHHRPTAGPAGQAGDPGRPRRRPAPLPARPQRPAGRARPAKTTARPGWPGGGCRRPGRPRPTAASRPSPTGLKDDGDAADGGSDPGRRPARPAPGAAGARPGRADRPARGRRRRHRRASRTTPTTRSTATNRRRRQRRRRGRRRCAARVRRPGPSATANADQSSTTGAGSRWPGGCRPGLHRPDLARCRRPRRPTSTTHPTSTVTGRARPGRARPTGRARSTR